MSENLQVLSYILTKLDKCKSSGKDSWKACCPAHDDKSPSFYVRLADNGRVLMKCFSGCSIDEICASLGVEVSSLFPATDKTYYPRLGEAQRATEPTCDTHYIAHFKNAVKQGYKPSEKELHAYQQAVLREARA